MAIRQRHVLSKLQRIAKQTLKRKIKHNLLRLVSKFYHLNKQLLRVNITLQAYNSFWTYFLSIGFPAAVLIFTYQLYFLTSNSRLPNSRKYFYIFIILELIAVMYLNIEKCAQVVKYNEQCLRENRRFYMRLIQLVAIRKDSKIIRHYLKVSS